MPELIDLLKNSAPFLAGIGGVVLACYKFLTGWRNFNDRPFTQRNFKRLAMLECESGNNPAMLEMLAIARSEEAYRSLFGRHATPASMDAVNNLIRTRQFAIADLKAAQMYMKVEGGRVTVTVGIFAWAVFWSLTGMVAMLGVLVLALAAALLNSPTVADLIGVIGVTILFLVFCHFTAPEARAVIIGSRIRDKLASMSIPPEA